MLRVAAGAPAFAVRSDGGGVRAVGVGDVWIPAESRRHDVGPLHAARCGPVRLGRRGARRARSPRERLERKLVLVGVTALGFGDQHVTPLGERLPGVEIHAQAAREHLRRPGPGPAALGGVGRGGCLLAAGAAGGRRSRRWWACCRAALLALGLGAGAARRQLRRVPAARARCSTASRRRSGSAMVFTAMLGGALAEADRQRRALRAAAPGGARGRGPARGRARGGAAHPARPPAPAGERVPRRGALPDLRP